MILLHCVESRNDFVTVQSPGMILLQCVVFKKWFCYSVESRNGVVTVQNPEMVLLQCRVKNLFCYMVQSQEMILVQGVHVESRKDFVAVQSVEMNFVTVCSLKKWATRGPVTLSDPKAQVMLEHQHEKRHQVWGTSRCQHHHLVWVTSRC